MPCPYHTLKILWTPVSTGVTTFYENIILDGIIKSKISPPLAGGDEGEGNR